MKRIGARPQSNPSHNQMLRGVVASQRNLQDCHTCGQGNPCVYSHNIENHGFYYTHCDPSFFVQCDEWGGCFEQPCAPGTIWSQAYKTCCNESTGCNGEGEEISDAEGEEISALSPLEDRAVALCGNIESFYPKTESWPPSLPNESECTNNDECKSCCCGDWGHFKVCIQHEGQARPIVCPL